MWRSAELKFDKVVRLRHGAALRLARKAQSCGFGTTKVVFEASVTRVQREQIAEISQPMSIRSAWHWNNLNRLQFMPACVLVRCR